MVEADYSREAVAILFDWTCLGFDHYHRQKEWGSHDYLHKQLGVVAYMGESLCDVAIAEDGGCLVGWWRDTLARKSRMLILP